jgi:hypothetical protein
MEEVGMKNNRYALCILFCLYVVHSTSISAQISDQNISGLTKQLVKLQKNITDFSQCVTGKKECTRSEKIVKYTAATAIVLFLIAALTAFRVRTADTQRLANYEKRIADIERERENLSDKVVLYWQKEGRDPANDVLIYNFFATTIDLNKLKNNLEETKKPFATLKERKHFIQDKIEEPLEEIESDLKKVKKILATIKE